MSIKRLPAQLANQIAAGEVVERPSSVVKELMENSLDAGATSIEVDIEKGGHKRIRIRDNGGGIDKAELELALAPHSTSKIETLDDLENIASLGFRGEALASISSVSRLTLTSKPANQAEAWSASAQGRDMVVDIQPAAHPDGTTIDVCDLFFNTPARRKFLRAEKTEFQHIEDVLRRIALSRPRVSFLLKHNQKVIKRWPASKQDAEQKRIAQVCGKQFAEQARPVSLDYDGVTLRAWVGGPELMRSATDLQFSFVNGRAMRDKLLLHAIRQAYETMLETVEQPAYVVFIDLSPGDVDVNVHPAKHEVRFQNARQIHDLVCRAFQDALTDEQTSLEGNFEAKTAGSESQYREVSHTSAPNHDYIRPLEQKPTSAGNSLSAGNRFASSGSYVGERAPRKNASASYTALMTSSTSNVFRVGCHGILMTSDNDIYWVNTKSIIQAWLRQIINDATLAQPLLMPVSVVVEGQHASWISEWTNELKPNHFDIQLIHGKCLLKQVPATLRHLPWGKLFPIIIDNLHQTKEQRWESFINVLAELLSEFEQESQYCLDWFGGLSQEQQVSLTLSSKKPIDINDFLAWINQ